MDKGLGGVKRLKDVIPNSKSPAGQKCEATTPRHRGLAARIADEGGMQDAAG